MLRIVQPVFLVCAIAAATLAQPDSLSAGRADTATQVRKDSDAGAGGSLSPAGFDRVVVTGTRTPRPVKDNPANVTVITREQIESSAATNVSDLLLYEPGIIVKRPVGMGEGVPSDIDMRGVPGATAATRTLVLVDGIPTNVAGTPFLILNEVPMESIERIEIVRGPYSNLYGPNAFGGVVNIITKTPGKDIHGEVSAGGMKNFYDAGAMAQGTEGRFSFLADGSARGIVNYYGRDTIDHIFGHYDRRTNADNYGYYDKRFFGKFSYAISSRALLTLNTRYFDSDLGFGVSELGHPPATMTTQGRKFLVGPVLKVNISPSFDIRISGYFRTLTGRFFGQGVTADSAKDSVQSIWTSVSNDWQVDAQSTLRLGSHNTMIAGFDFLNNAIDFGPLTDAATGALLSGARGADKGMKNGGLYVQDELRFWRLITTAGLRLDDNSVFGLVPSPRFGLIYKQNSMLRLKFSAGRAFRAPSLGELYMPDMPINTGTILQADSLLRPEYIWTLDGGPEIDITKWLNVRFSGFYNKMDDLITQRITNPYFQGIFDYAVLSHVNTEKAWSGGIESTCEIRMGQSAAFFFNYTYTKSEDMTLNSSLEYIPQHQFNTGVYFRKSFGRWALNGSVLENYVGRRDYLDWLIATQDIQSGIKPLPSSPADITPSPTSLAPYFRTDLSLKLTFMNLIWLGLEGMNVFNADIQESAGTFAPMRFFEGKVGVKF
jgi:outer membrane cobalamin receptor